MGGPPAARQPPGRPLEAAGNVRPRWMAAATGDGGTGSGLQADSPDNEIWRSASGFRMWVARFQLGGRARGSSKEKVAPSPAALSTQIRPPCISTIVLDT